MPTSADPPTRADRQRRTREALVHAARAVFADVGYHGATLEGIAREAGYSKGAVYSNFENKAQLFLAVFDENVEHTLAADRADDDAEGSRDAVDPLAVEIQAAIRGFGLATLEFIASAARDESLRDELGRRMRQVVEGYALGIAEVRQEADSLSATDLGALVVALNQGASLLMLSGSHVDADLLQSGIERLLAPSDPHASPSPTRGDDPLLHAAGAQARIAAWVRREYGAAHGEQGP